MAVSDLPDWWVRHVALERLNCRSFFTPENWIEYDLDLTDENLKIVAEAKVLITGPYSVLDEVDPISVTPRMTRGIGGSYFEPLNENMLNEGKLSSDSFAQPGNPIETADPITSLSSNMYVRHGEDIYQWEVAELRKGTLAGQEGRFPPRERSFQISDEFPELFYRAQRKHQEIHHLRNQVNSEEISKNEGRERMQDRYDELREIYQEYYDDIYEYSQERVSEYEDQPKPRKPPTLTGIDRAVRVDEEGNVHGKTSVEALTYRTAVKEALEARKAHKKLEEDRQVTHIEKELEHSATAIILSVQSLEAYINGVAQEELPDYWENLEKANIRAKWQTVPHLVTGGKVFESGEATFGKFTRAVRCRNQIVHFKKDTEEFVERDDYGYVSPVIEYANHREAYKAVSAVKEMIEQFSEARGEPSPDWVNSNLWIYGKDPGGIDDPLAFDYWASKEGE
ncbi:hypothetical protein [Halonotius pteroides]|nr:hypothetical protein [Halonotius pteroides]